MSEAPAGLPVIRATRYVTPLREGGSLPGIVEGEDLGTYVCKFRGAGQGVRVLVAEVVVAGLARAVGVPVPELVGIDLAPEIGRYEADEEVQDLLTKSVGLNLGVDFLPRSFGYDAAYTPPEDLAARILWLDALVANVDRSWRNPNLLVWRGALYAIDHGACLYFLHAWTGGVGDPERFAAAAYDAGEHVLASFAAPAAALDTDLRARLDEPLVRAVLATVPDEWLEPVPGAPTPDAVREAYLRFLLARLASRAWVPGVSS